MKKIACAVILLSIWIPGPGVAAENPVGMIKTLEGKAFIVRQGQTVSVEIGTRFFEGDLLNTAQDGSLGFILKDNTVMTLGPASELEISKFLFSPAEENLSLVVRMIKGTATFLTGMIGQLSPSAVKIETPEATIGIRGTRFAVRVI
jgi:hypothetical protein